MSNDLTFITAERAFVSMVQALFYDEPDVYWRPDPEESRVNILTDVSEEEQEWLPQVRVGVGANQDALPSINKLIEQNIDINSHWSEQIKQYAYVERSLVMFACYSSVRDESFSMAQKIRRALHLARTDLGQTGLFGLSNAQVSRPEPARRGTVQDNVYVSICQSPFIYVDRETYQPDPNTSLFNAFGLTLKAVDPADEEELFTFGAEDEPHEPVSDVSAETFVLENTNKGYIEFSGPIRLIYPERMEVKVGGKEVLVMFSRSYTNQKRLNISNPDSPLMGTVTFGFTTGALEDDDQLPIRGIDSITATHSS